MAFNIFPGDQDWQQKVSWGGLFGSPPPIGQAPVIPTATPPTGSWANKLVSRLNSPAAQLGLRILANNRPGVSVGANLGQSYLGYQQDQAAQQQAQLQQQLMQAQIAKMQQPQQEPDQLAMLRALQKDPSLLETYSKMHPSGSVNGPGELDIARALADDPNDPKQVRVQLQKILDRKYRDPAGEPMVPVQTPQGVIYMPRSQVSGRPVPQPESNAKPTIGEQQAAMLATRLRMAQDGLKNLDSSAATPGVLENIAKGIPIVGGETAANIFRSSGRRQADSMQVDALDAALTLATGATYTPEQLQNLRKSYFPQLLDDEKTKKSKEERFNTLVKAAMERAGAAAPSINRAMGVQQPSSAIGGIDISAIDAELAKRGAK